MHLYSVFKCRAWIKIKFWLITKALIKFTAFIIIMSEEQISKDSQIHLPIGLSGGHNIGSF